MKSNDMKCMGFGSNLNIYQKQKLREYIIFS